MTRNYVKSNAKLKAKQETSLDLKKMLVPFGKNYVFIKLSFDSQDTNKDSSEFILAYACCISGRKG